jgi:hypothetical protein
MIVTGVVKTTELDVQVIYDEWNTNSISLGYYEHEKECKEEFCDCDVYEFPVLLGAWKKVKGKWEPSKKKGDFSAIIQSEDEYVQIVWSKYAILSRWCSPCFPRQGDITSEGNILTYCLPPEFHTPEFLKENLERMYVRTSNGHLRRLRLADIPAWRRDEVEVLTD